MKSFFIIPSFNGKDYIIKFKFFNINNLDFVSFLLNLEIFRFLNKKYEFMKKQRVIKRIAKRVAKLRRRSF